MSSWTSILTADCKSWVAYSILILSEDRNFSPPPDLLFIPSNCLCSECLPVAGKQREREAAHVIVLGGNIKSDWSYNGFKFIFIFLILSCHLCLGPTWYYSLKTIMSIVCFKKTPAAPLINSCVLESFANLPVTTVISVLFVRPSAHLNGTTGLPQD
jgi:hypothetical protein